MLQCEKFRRVRPSWTSLATSHEMGDTLLYQGQTVLFVWQSRQARSTTATTDPDGFATAANEAAGSAGGLVRTG